MIEFVETLFPEWTQRFTVEEILYRKKTEHQDLLIFRNADFGRVMALDGAVQTTEGDEFVYHEMMAHVPLLAHGRAQRVLVVGGGDGAMLREVLKHAAVERVTHVEIDREVIEVSRRHLPDHSQGAWDDPRVRLVIADGLAFVRESGDAFDVIISDSTDPVGPGEALYTPEFYAACRERLTPGGVFVAQNGNIFQQLDEVTTTAARLAPLFADVAFYAAAVPTYIGGLMAFAWASEDPALRRVPVETLERRQREAGIETRYYTPALHAAAFALPRFLESALAQARH